MLDADREEAALLVPDVVVAARSDEPVEAVVELFSCPSVSLAVTLLAFAPNESDRPPFISPNLGVKAESTSPKISKSG